MRTSRFSESQKASAIAARSVRANTLVIVHDKTLEARAERVTP